MKRILSLTLVLLLLLSVTAFADYSYLLRDDADLLTSDEEAQLAEKLGLLQDKHGIDFAVVTSDSLYGYSDVVDAAIYAYESSGFAVDGVLLFICMDTREWYVLTSGVCRNEITDGEIMDFEDDMLDELSNGYYYYAFETFAVGAADALVFGDSYDYDYDADYNEDAEFSVTGTILGSLVIGLIAALIVTGVMRAQLKSVKAQDRAASYIVSGSMRLTESHDLFLYKTVSKQKKADNNSSGGSRSSGGGVSRSSGRSYGGRGGRF